MRCKTEAINSAVGTVWREVSRLEDELRKAEDKIKWLGGALRYHGLEGQSAPDDRDARINELNCEVVGLQFRLKSVTDERDCMAGIAGEKARDVQRLTSENNDLKHQLANHTKRDGRINDLSFENDQLKKQLETMARSLSDSEKALAFYENLAAKQAGTDETHVSIPISAMSNVYVLWDKNDVFCPASMGYNSLEKARAVRDKGVNKDIDIARMVWVKS